VGWNANTGPIAEFTFEVQASAAGQYQWPISVTDVVVSENGFNNQSFLPGTAIFIARNPIAPTLGSVSRSPSGDVGFTITGDAGANYVIEVSEDLTHWTTLKNVSNSPASLSIIDTQTPTGHRFYRAKVSP